MAVTWKALAYSDDVILKTVADANSVLYAISDNTPAALAMAASTVVARLAAGNVVAASVAEMQTLLGIGGAPAAHDLLAASHGDTLADAVTDGDIIIGNATPKWSSLAITVPGAGLINHLAVANGETRPSWKALFDATVPGTIAPSDAAVAGTATVAARRDHAHATPATYPPTAHALSGHTAATADIALAGYQATNHVVHTVADATARLALTPVVGKLVWQTDTLALYACTVSV